MDRLARHQGVQSGTSGNVSTTLVVHRGFFTLPSGRVGPKGRREGSRHTPCAVRQKQSNTKPTRGLTARWGTVGQRPAADLERSRTRQSLADCMKRKSCPTSEREG